MKSAYWALLLVLPFCPTNGALAADSWVVRENGVGPVKVGMNLAQLNAVLHEKFAMPAEKEDRACFYVTPRGHPHLSFMIEEGHVARVDVDSPGTLTNVGIQVGDTEDQALKTYGDRLKVSPHKYTDGHYLTAQSTDRRYGIRFETDQGKISTYYAGLYEAIQYVEGCQ